MTGGPSYHCSDSGSGKHLFSLSKHKTTQIGQLMFSLVLLQWHAFPAEWRAASLLTGAESGGHSGSHEDDDLELPQECRWLKEKYWVGTHPCPPSCSVPCCFLPLCCNLSPNTKKKKIKMAMLLEGLFVAAFVPFSVLFILKYFAIGFSCWKETLKEQDAWPSSGVCECSSWILFSQYN